MDAGRVERFQREARLLASLNHPNIAGIYGLEESGGTNSLVMELIEGETLAERLKQGAIPVEESLKLALQKNDSRFKIGVTAYFLFLNFSHIYRLVPEEHGNHVNGLIPIIIKLI